MSSKNKRKKTYLGFFYGNKQELTKAFTKITDGDIVRYILTSETLICRFKSNKSITEIMGILNETCLNISSFVFPISNSSWGYNLPPDVVNNLLTDKTIIQNSETQILTKYLELFVEEVKKKNVINLQTELKNAIDSDNFELAMLIRDEIKKRSENVD